jgi:ABC transport system ATP-binding/permease protein
VLEDYLEDFPGVVITVSHDRYFLDKVVDQLIELKGDGKTDTFYGNYSEYLERQMVQVSPKATPTSTKGIEQEKPKKKRMSYKEKKEWEEIDETISTVEERIEEITLEINKTGSDFEKAQKLMQEQANLNEKLEELIERWSFLSELAESE